LPLFEISISDIELTLVELVVIPIPKTFVQVIPASIDLNSPLRVPAYTYPFGAILIF